MRIVFMSWRDLAHPQAGGAEVVLDRLATGLQARGHEVSLLCGAPVAPRPYPVHRMGGTFTQYFRAPFTFWRRVGRRADVVVDVSNGIPYFSPLWQRASVVCLVHHVHTLQWRMSFSAPLAALGRWLESRAMPRLYRRARFVAVSDSTRQALVGLGVDDRHVTTVEMGVTAPLLEPTRSANPAPRFLVLGRLVPHKRVELALQMWERVRPQTGGSLVVIGDGPELRRLRAIAGPDVEFTRYLTEDEKWRELSAATLLVHPAHHEGWGTVVMEAAAAGLPTVGFDVAGVRDSVVDGTTGLLAVDEDAFVDAWIHLATDDEARARMGTAARARAASFRWDDAVTAFEAVVTAGATPH
jgi:glycosyltransferase involved in cell wall biosynthesis